MSRVAFIIGVVAAIIVLFTMNNNNDNGGGNGLANFNFSGINLFPDNNEFPNDSNVNPDQIDYQSREELLSFEFSPAPSQARNSLNLFANSQNNNNNNNNSNSPIRSFAVGNGQRNGRANIISNDINNNNNNIGNNENNNEIIELNQNDNENNENDENENQNNENNDQTEPRQLKPNQKPVWLHYSTVPHADVEKAAKGEKQAKCNHCGKVISRRPTRLASHIIRECKGETCTQEIKNLFNKSGDYKIDTNTNNMSNNKDKSATYVLFFSLVAYIFYYLFVRVYMYRFYYLLFDVFAAACVFDCLFIFVCIVLIV